MMKLFSTRATCLHSPCTSTHGVTWRQDSWVCNPSLFFLFLNTCLWAKASGNLQMVPCALSKHKNYISVYKTKKDGRHSCGRAGWSSCPGMASTSLLFLNLVTIWLCSALSLTRVFAHNGTKSRGILIPKRALGGWLLGTAKTVGKGVYDFYPLGIYYLFLLPQCYDLLLEKYCPPLFVHEMWWALTSYAGSGHEHMDWVRPSRPSHSREFC